VICSECRNYYEPEHYLHFCNSCGRQLERQYDALQEFRSGTMTMMEVASRAVFGESAQVERVWRVG
jgi:hypothetical protein